MNPSAFRDLVRGTLTAIERNQELYLNDRLDALLVESISDKYSMVRSMRGTALAYQSHHLDQIMTSLENDLLAIAKVYDVADLDDYRKRIN